MFLKSLEIFGFKSFPDRVKIEFADGITASWDLTVAEKVM